MPGRWVVVVPVKDAAAGKTRLSGVLDGRTRAALARAMALDTIAATIACPLVGLVIVVTADDEVRREAPHVAAPRRPGGSITGSAAVQVMPEPTHADARSGLDAAAAAGVVAARSFVPTARVAVLLGDIPALRPEDLASALGSAEELERGMVADTPGTGTTLLAVAPGVPFDSRFGVDSAAAHTALGYARLDVAESSTLRHDVDLPGDLDVLLHLHPGPRTARLLGRLFPEGVAG